MKTVLLSVVSGIVWSVIAALILWQRESWGRIHDIRWLACAGGPFVGLAIYYASRWVYSKKVGLRIFWAIVSLYLASGLFGLILGILVWSNRNPGTTAGVIFEPIIACWWGITFVPFLWLLFPLSYFNHQLLRRYEKPA